MKVAILEGYGELNRYQKAIGELTVEEKVNKFLDEHPRIEIDRIKQSCTSGDEGGINSNYTTISIWYEEE
nr:MAG TPA: Sporulation protein Cse60 [Caudoviricetes sp.]